MKAPQNTGYQIAHGYLQTWWQIAAKVSFYPILFILAGGTILSLQNGPTLGISITLYCLWVAITLPLWLQGNYWIMLIYPLSRNSIAPISALLGYHLIMIAFVILGIILLIQTPKLVFTFQFFNEGHTNPTEASSKLTQGKYFFIAWRLALATLFSVLAQFCVPIIVQFFLSFFTTLYTENYIFWADILRPTGYLIVSMLSSLLAYKYFDHLKKTLQKSAVR